MEDAIDLLLQLHRRAGNLTDSGTLKKAILQQEAAVPAVLTHGVAVPHCKGQGVTRTALAALSLKTPIAWGAHTVHTVFLLASADERQHIEALAALAQALQNGDTTTQQP